MVDWTARYRQGARGRLASRPAPIPVPSALGEVDPLVVATYGAAYEDVKAQPVRLADVFVFGPLMIYSGLGKATPNWLRVGMVIIGAGTIVYNLYNYFEVERRKVSALSGMEAGPMHKADPRIHSPINLVKGLR
jgi:hypothetical protein